MLRRLLPSATVRSVTPSGWAWFGRGGASRFMECWCSAPRRQAQRLRRPAMRRRMPEAMGHTASSKEATSMLITPPTPTLTLGSRLGKPAVWKTRGGKRGRMEGVLKNWRKVLCRRWWNGFKKKVRGLKGSVRGRRSEWDLDFRRAKRWCQGINWKCRKGKMKWLQMRKEKVGSSEGGGIVTLTWASLVQLLDLLWEKSRKMKRRGQSVLEVRWRLLRGSL